MISPVTKQKNIKFQIAGELVQLSFSEPVLCNLLKKGFPSFGDSRHSPYVNFKMISATGQAKNLSRLILFNKKNIRRGVPYYYHPQDLSSLTLRNIKFELSALIQYFLLDRQILLLHASSAIYKGVGYLFPGPSGTGKSTLASNFPKDSVLSDDISVVKKVGRRFYLYSSPFDYGKFRYKKIKKVPLKGIFFLRKHSSINIQSVDLPYALTYLFDNVNLISYGQIINEVVINKDDLLIKKRGVLQSKGKETWNIKMKKIHKLLFGMLVKVGYNALYFTKKIAISDIDYERKQLNQKKIGIGGT